jgi:hypothetical protein
VEENEGFQVMNMLKLHMQVNCKNSFRYMLMHSEFSRLHKSLNVHNKLVICGRAVCLKSLTSIDEIHISVKILRFSYFSHQANNTWLFEEIMLFTFPFFHTAQLSAVINVIGSVLRCYRNELSNINVWFMMGFYEWTSVGVHSFNSCKGSK